MIQMKKIVILLMISVFIVGCSHKEVEKNENQDEKKDEIIEQKEEYMDNNSMPIAFYRDTGTGQIVLVKDYQIPFVKGTDIGLFQIYPSNEEEIAFQGTFGDFFYKQWNTLDTDKTHKMGFHLSYELEDGTKISHYVYDPSTAMTYKPYVKVYLYDDYIHRNDSWYSHIEEEQYNEDTYLTSIKLTPGSDINKVSSSIVLTVFTYDTEDDFDENGNYRGVSQYRITIDNK